MANSSSGTLASKLRARMLQFSPSKSKDSTPVSSVQKDVQDGQNSSSSIPRPEAGKAETGTPFKRSHSEGNEIDTQSGISKPLELHESETGDGEKVEIKKKKIKSEEFHMDDEDLEYARGLWRKVGTDDPPTASQLKVLRIKGLTKLLRYNERPVYPDMDLNKLAQMVLDFMKNGCPPPCPSCPQGKLRFSNGKKTRGKRYYWCPGFTNNGKNFYQCKFKADRTEITRIPWKCP